MQRIHRDRRAACVVTGLVGGTLLWANLIPVVWANEYTSPMGGRREEHLTLGWPMRIVKSTRTIWSAPLQPPEDPWQQQVLYRGILINLAMGTLVSASTCWVAVHFARRRFRFHLSDLFALTVVGALLSATYLHMAAIEDAIDSRFCLSRLLEIPSDEYRVFASDFGCSGLWFPFYIRVPVLVGVAALFFVVGKGLLAVGARVFALVAASRTRLLSDGAGR